MSDSKMASPESIKLEQLRQDIRAGLNSGETTPWDPEEIKREGRKRRAARVKAGHEDTKDNLKVY